MKLYQAIAQNERELECLEHDDVPNRETREAAAEDRAARILAALPRGSGFDRGTTIARATAREVVLHTAFHHMDDHGSYCGWTEHFVSLRASLVHDYTLHVRGQNKRGIKDYIADVFHQCLTQEFLWVSPEPMGVVFVTTGVLHE